MVDRPRHGHGQQQDACDRQPGRPVAGDDVLDPMVRFGARRPLPGQRHQHRQHGEDFQGVQQRQVGERRRFPVGRQVDGQQYESERQHYRTAAHQQVSPPVCSQGPRHPVPGRQRSPHQGQYGRQRGGDRPHSVGDPVDLPVDLGSQQDGENPVAGGVHGGHDPGKLAAPQAQDRVVGHHRNDPDRPSSRLERVVVENQRQEQRQGQGGKQQDPGGSQPRPADQGCGERHPGQRDRHEHDRHVQAAIGGNLAVDLHQPSQEPPADPPEEEEPGDILAALEQVVPPVDHPGGEQSRGGQQRRREEIPVEEDRGAVGVGQRFADVFQEETSGEELQENAAHQEDVEAMANAHPHQHRSLQGPDHRG